MYKWSIILPFNEIMQNYPVNPRFYMFFHWETPGNHRFDLFIKSVYTIPTNKCKQSNYNSMTLNT